MTKEEAYRIFIDEIAKGDEKLKVLAEENVMMPIAFNSAWAMASKNQESITKSELIGKACEYLKANTHTFRSDELLEDFVKAMND